MMRQVIKDIEEALKREFTQITTQDKRTKTSVFFKSTYDVFTGEVKQVPLEAHFFNENSHPNQVQYPRIDITFDTIEEDRTSGRMLSIWEDYNTDYREIVKVNPNRPRVFEPVVSGAEGISQGNYFSINSIKLAKVQPNYLLKIICGNNKGTYRIKAIDVENSRVELESILLENIEGLSFNTDLRNLYFLDNVDLFSVKAGDIFVDDQGVEFKIAKIRTKYRELKLLGNAIPSLGVGSFIKRTANVLSNIDSVPVRYIIMNPEKFKTNAQDCHPLTDGYLLSHNMTPLNYYYTVEIKNKERQLHVEMAERMTETIINRPRRAIKLALRTDQSAESEVVVGPDIGTGQVVSVKDASQYIVNDLVYFINKYSVSEVNQIIDIDYHHNTIVLRYKVDREFQPENKTALVSNVKIRYWSMFLNTPAIISQDATNNFWRQSYEFRFEGWKQEKTGEKDQSGIAIVKGTIETPDNAVEDFEI
jgi:hypothetical protein